MVRSYCFGMANISQFGVLVPGDKLLGALDAYYCTVEGVSEQGGVMRQAQPFLLGAYTAFSF